jgi:hypothetical protein
LFQVIKEVTFKPFADRDRKSTFLAVDVIERKQAFRPALHPREMQRTRVDKLDG